MFKKVDSWIDLIEMEHKVLDFWKKNDSFKKLVEKNKNGQKWSFLDGPITANNPMGVHHAWGRTLKDSFQRYHAMLGQELRYQNGFDCQGLWVEVEVEKEKGFKTKKDIEAYGVEKFVQDCKDRVIKFSKVQTEQSIRLGYWMDWDNSYYTMTDENNYTIWSFLKKCHERGLIYRGHDVMPWCPRCGTGLSQHEMQEGYQERKDPSIVVIFPLKEREGESLLVWTTTPWTLSSNVGAAVNPEIDYVKVKEGDKVYYMAEKLLSKVLKSDYEIIEKMKGTALEGLTYHGPFDELPAQNETKDLHRVVLWEDVSEEDGTGIVHIAPGCGKEDFELGKKVGLPPVMPINDMGIFVDGFGFLTGKLASEVVKDVVINLKEKEILYKSGKITHSYPHCWRCSTPLLYRLVDEWFISMDEWREEIMEVTRQIKWIPSYGKDLELDWLKNMRDWMISKKRYWGLTLPIWNCKSCGHFDVIGSKEELKEKAVEGFEEFEGHSPHKPFVDKVKIRCEKCGEVMERVPDVGNPWLDAGIVPYSTMKYSSDREYWKKWFPAELVLECFPGQFRNWFYALLAMSTMMENKPPFKTLLGHALVKDEKGSDMHKSKGNAIWFDEAVEKMGGDVMRWIYCSQDTTKNLNFGYGIGREVRGKFINTLWNTYSFFVNYANVSKYDPEVDHVEYEKRPDIDRWILSRLQTLIKNARKNFEEYNLKQVTKEVELFVGDLSNWYVRRSRRRFWKGVEDFDGKAAHDTLYEVLISLIKIVAPIIPFMSEEIYQNLKSSKDVEESVHHTSYPEVDEKLIDEDLSWEMDTALRITSLALSARKEANLRVRQPLSEMIIFPANPREYEASVKFSDIFIDELNIKKVTVKESEDELDVSYTIKPNFKKLGPKLGKNMKKSAQIIGEFGEDEALKFKNGEIVTIDIDGEKYELSSEDVIIGTEVKSDLALVVEGNTKIALVKTLTEELKQEGLMRDLLRRLQVMRKDEGLEIEDRINIKYDTNSKRFIDIFEKWGDFLKEELLALTIEKSEIDDMKEIEVQEEKLKIKITKS